LRAPAQAYIPAIAEIDINNRPMIAPSPPPTLRVSGLIKFPNDRDQSDAWFLDNVIRELAKCEGVTRVMSSNALIVPEEKLREFSPGEPKQFVWHRWFEFRFTQYATWAEKTRALFEQAQATCGIKPYDDLVTTLHLERPDWTMADHRPYP
jgi:hypothetical protein